MSDIDDESVSIPDLFETGNDVDNDTDDTDTDTTLVLHQRPPPREIASLWEFSQLLVDFGAAHFRRLRNSLRECSLYGVLSLVCFLAIFLQMACLPLHFHGAFEEKLGSTLSEVFGYFDYRLTSGHHFGGPIRPWNRLVMAFKAHLVFAQFLVATYLLCCRLLARSPQAGFVWYVLLRLLVTTIIVLNRIALAQFAEEFASWTWPR